MEYQIGEFSRITGLTVKTLRYYHEQGLLEPCRVDPDSAYRYYGQASLERARAIAALKSLDFDNAEIAAALAGCDDDADLVDLLRRKAESLDRAVADLRRKRKRIQALIDLSLAGRGDADGEARVVRTEPRLVFTERYTGRYDRIGESFGRLFRRAGFRLAGPPFALYHDLEWREDGADIEAGLPVRDAEGLPPDRVRVLAPVEAVAVLHRGGYDTLSDAYARLFAAARSLGRTPEVPIRETYLKGPGLVFPGNPRRYQTEIVLPLSGLAEQGRAGRGPEAQPGGNQGAQQGGKPEQPQR